MKTFSYVLGNKREIEIGNTYYFGEIWNGKYGGKQLLKSGCICIDEKTATIVDFTVIERNSEDILKSIVKVTDVY